MKITGEDIKDGATLVVLVLVVWCGVSIVFDIVAVPTTRNVTGVLDFRRSYFGDAGNTTYSIYTVHPTDGSGQFNVTYACNYFQNGQTVHVSEYNHGNAWLFYPLVHFPDLFILNSTVSENIPRGC